MDVGVQVIFSSFGSDASDSVVFSEEVRLCELAEDLGFDVIWPVEHHFTDYSFCPDNTQFLTYLAGRTSTIDLGTAARLPRRCHGTSPPLTTAHARPNSTPSRLGPGPSRSVAPGA